MKVSYDILKKFVVPPKDAAARELAETFTMSTVEIDGYVDLKERLANVVLGTVLDVKPHPNADKLKLAAVDAGKETFDVVCGGVNLKQGMKVAFARIGALVKWHGEDKWTELQAAKIRGVESKGMICSAEELDLPDDKAVEHGIMDLSHVAAKPGTPLAEALGMNDVILEVDNKSITHRPDLWGHLGLARELAAVWHVPFTYHEPPVVKPEGKSSLSVAVQAPEKCFRYLGVVLGNIRMAPSPAWLQDALRNLGVRPINNVVDVTNYVMLELGQPLHAFDLKKLASADIVIREAKKGETMATLDGVERKMAPGMLVIADKKHAQAIAGVMGGAASEVTEATTEIVLESANFEAVGIRKTASALGMRTEASMRFEKALDPELAETALRRAVELFKEVIPDMKVLSNVVDEYPRPIEPKSITLDLPWLMRRLGTEIPAERVKAILGSLGFNVEGKGDAFRVTPPTWRATRDVTIPEDLIEEVARIYGYGNIPLAMPKFDITPPKRDEAQELRWKIRDLLVGAGLTETLSYSFVGSGEDARVELENPADQSKRYLRPNIVSSFREQFDSARRAGSGSVRMFELGRVFGATKGVFSAANKGSDKLPAQPWHLVIASYDSSRGSLRMVKGAIEMLEYELGVKLKAEYVMSQDDGAIAEIDLEGDSISAPRAYRPLPKYPSVTRDVSVVVPSGVAWADMDKSVRKASELVCSVEVFDVYQKEGSVAFHITFRSSERTLKSEEVDEVMAKITDLLRSEFGAEVRA